MELHFQICSPERESRASIRFRRCIQPTHKCLYPICLDCMLLRKGFRSYLSRLCQDSTRLWWFS